MFEYNEKYEDNGVKKFRNVKIPDTRAVKNLPIQNAEHLKSYKGDGLISLVNQV